MPWRCTGVYNHDFEDFAGITNNAGVGVNGNIIVTAGVGTFSLAMKLKKH
ncbi:MAG: hypothetical protein DDT31_00519 [Syntrophomonadaceae bacterium]|nr:hypothetical protein [Bacillota bacterium]